MKKTWILKISIVVLLLAYWALLEFIFTGFNVSNKVEVKSATSDVIGIDQKALEDINVLRRGAGLEDLRFDPRLSASARKKAEDMKNRDYFDHVGPNGEEPWSFFEAENYNYKYAGENLYQSFDGTDTTDGLRDNFALKAWLNSESHKENLLDKRFTDIGIGRVDRFIVHHFGITINIKE